MAPYLFSLNAGVPEADVHPLNIWGTDPHQNLADKYHTIQKSKNMSRAKYVSNFLICGANMLLNWTLWKNNQNTINVLFSESANKGGMVLVLTLKRMPI